MTGNSIDYSTSTFTKSGRASGWTVLISVLRNVTWRAWRTLRIARQNVWLAIGVKVAVLLLAVVGLATMWMAVFADVGVTVLAVLNAMRTLRLH